MPGWNEHVKQHSDRKKLWHEIWVAMDRPRDGYQWIDQEMVILLK